MDDTPAEVLPRSALQRITAGVVIALSGTLLGAGALLVAVLTAATTADGSESRSRS